MSLNIAEDIRTITDLKEKTGSVLEQVHETKRPVVLMEAGKAEAVLMDAEEYENVVNAFNLLKLLVPAEEDVRDMRYKEARTFFEEFKRDKKLRDKSEIIHI